MSRRVTLPRSASRALPGVLLVVSGCQDLLGLTDTHYESDVGGSAGAASGGVGSGGVGSGGVGSGGVGGAGPESSTSGSTRVSNASSGTTSGSGGATQAGVTAGLGGSAAAEGRGGATDGGAGADGVTGTAGGAGATDANTTGAGGEGGVDGDTGSGGAATSGPTSTSDGVTTSATQGGSLGGSGGTGGTGGSAAAGGAGGSVAAGGAGGSSASVCGDGFVDPTEECDGTPGCTDCELDHFLCSPLTDVGCAPGQRCIEVTESWFTCVEQTGEGGVGAECSNMGDDDACATGLTCLGWFHSAYCDTSSFCCTPTCVLGEAQHACPPPTDPEITALCRTFFFISDPPEDTGLEWLGSCLDSRI